MTLGKKLKKLCDERRWRQSDLVAIVGDMHKSTMSNWWHDKFRPDLDSALKIARALGVPLDYLADDALDEPPRELSEEERMVLDAFHEEGITCVEAVKRLGREVVTRRPKASDDPRDVPFEVEVTKTTKRSG